MEVSLEEKRREAVDRMKAMKILPQAVKEFEESGRVFVSEPPLGGLFELDDGQRKTIADFEREYNALVYFAVRSYTNFGTMDSFFYVSDHKDEWESDRHDIKYDVALVYVHNHDMPDCSELGYIAFKRTPAASVLRKF